MSNKASFIFFAITSGLFAALSSVFAKLFSDEKTRLLHSYIISQLNFVPEEVNEQRKKKETRNSLLKEYRQHY
jgi:hypothetical protein